MVVPKTCWVLSIVCMVPLIAKPDKPGKALNLPQVIPPVLWGGKKSVHETRSADILRFRLPSGGISFPTQVFTWGPWQGFTCLRHRVGHGIALRTFGRFRAGW